MSTSTPVDPLTIPWRPMVDDVAALVRARTKNASGQETGTFTSETRPTDAEVEQLITNGCAKVASVTGWVLPADAQEEGRHLAALYAACEVELSYWPDQLGTGRSSFDQLWQLYQYDIDRFADYVAQLAPAAGGGIGVRSGTMYTPSSTVAFAYQLGWGVWPLSDVVNVGRGGGT